MSKLKISGYLLAALALIGVGYKLAPNPASKEVIVYQDRVVVKDHIVTKDVVRTETRPDGTKIVTEEKSTDASHESEKEKRKESVTVSSNVTRYSLGVNYRPESIFSLKGVYGVEVGKRLWDSPCWANFTINSKREWTVGVRFEF